MNWRSGAVILTRLVLGGLFVYASVDKIVHPRAFAEIIYNYQILPGMLINISAIVLPWLELILGVLLISGRFMSGATLLCALLLSVFWAALLFNVARGLDIHCGCFSTQATDTTPMAWYVIRDAIFLTMGLYLFHRTVRLKRKNARQ